MIITQAAIYYCKSLLFCARTRAEGVPSQRAHAAYMRKAGSERINSHAHASQTTDSAHYTAWRAGRISINPSSQFSAICTFIPNTSHIRCGMLRRSPSAQVPPPWDSGLEWAMRAPRWAMIPLHCRRSAWAASCESLRTHGAAGPARMVLKCPHAWCRSACTHGAEAPARKTYRLPSQPFAPVHCGPPWAGHS